MSDIYSAILVATVNLLVRAEFRRGSILAGERRYHRQLRQLMTVVIDGR
jgi:hypothetical protein